MDLPRNSSNRKGLTPDSVALPDVVPQNADGTPVTQPSESSSESSVQTQRSQTDAGVSLRREWRECRHDARFTPYRKHNTLGKHTKVRSPKTTPLEDVGRRWRPLPVRGGLWLSHVVPKPGYPRKKYLPIAPRGFYWLTGTAATALVPLAPRHRYIRPRREVIDSGASVNFSEGEDLSSDDEDYDERLLFSRETLQSHSEQLLAARVRASRTPLDTSLQDSPVSGIISIVTSHSTKETSTPPTEEEVFVPNETDVDPQEVIVRSEDIELPQHEVTLQHEVLPQNESFHSEEALGSPLLDEAMDLTIKNKRQQD